MFNNYEKKIQTGTYKLRYMLIIGTVISLVGLVSAKLVSLHITDSTFLKKQGASRSVRVVNIPAYRGSILDRNNEPLAISTPIKSVWVEPEKFKINMINKTKLTKLANALGVSNKYIQARVNKYISREFIYLKRHINPAQENIIANLKLQGIHFQREFKRFYPHGAVSTHVVGFTDKDGNGLEGLELAYNDVLLGEQGKKKIVQDLFGREIERLGKLQPAQDGKNIQLSIDQRLQYLAHRALKNGIKKHNAVSGSAVILSVETGEVLAMTNWPTYNPNQRNVNFVQSSIRNRAVTDIFEPASAIKAFSLASILENTNSTAETMINTSPGRIKLVGGIVRDARNFGRIDLLTVMKRSSNVGLVKLIQKLKSPEALWDTYNRFGFGAETEVNFPGESTGILVRENTRKPFVLATMAFGYGVAVTPLQLARAYAVLGAHGIKRPASLIKLDRPGPGIQVVSSRVARQVLDMLTMVTKSKASRAKVPGYVLAGKTGTGRTLTKRGYVQNRHRAVYGGLAPAINSKFAIVVTINEPSEAKDQYYGNLAAAPVFAKIASDALRLYKVQPDLLETQGVYVANKGDDNVIR